MGDDGFMTEVYSLIKGVVKKIRDGLFLASSRTTGEQYIEPFIRKKYNLKDPTGNDYDGMDQAGKKYEIKTCKVLRETGNDKKTKSILDRILFESTNLETKRLVVFRDRETAKYLANVQNVKRDHFDYLIYVLLFADCVKIFWAKREEINTKDFSRWSDKHGRYDALGKSGQFGIDKNNIWWHLQNHLKDTVSYDEMRKVYTELS
ncbi:MAG: hypothetical protein WCV86_03755 [Patescibacteria group bacterium]|jgi:hypothetical protein